MSEQQTDPLLPGGAPAKGDPPAGGTNQQQLNLPPPADPPKAGIQLTNEQLTERLDRAKSTERKAFLKSLGFESEEQAREVIKAGETARQAALSAEQRLTEQLTTERARAERAEAELTEARFVAKLTGICAKRGITDFDYARYLVEQAAGGQDGFDAEAFLDQQLQNPQRRAALGIEAPPTTVPAPATTTPANPNQPPPRPAPNGGGQPFDAMKATPAELREHIAKNYA